MQPLGDLPGGNFASHAFGVSADGSVVVGRSITASGFEAFVWDAASEMRNLKDVLVDGGSDLTGWTLTSAEAISDNGRTIVGTGLNPDGNNEGWIAQIPPPSQKIILAWEHDSPFAVEKQTNAFRKTFHVDDPGGVMTAYDPTQFDPTLGLAFDQFKTDILLHVQQQFADSGITNVDVVNGAPEATAAVVYLADRDLANVTLGGRAVSGIDRFNTRIAGEAVAFISDLDFDPVQKVESIAEIITHEVGHLLGLRHVDPPGALAVMDYDSQAGDVELFTNGVFSIQEPPGPAGQGQILNATHNPIYHLKRYAVGTSHADLVSQGINPGTWDQPGAILGPISVDFLFGGASPATTLFDVSLLAMDGGGQDDRVFTQVANFNQITLGELSNMSFQIGALSGMALLGASAQGGLLDIALALGDPFAENALTLFPAPGDTAGFLQIASGVPAGFETLADVTLTVTTIPEPTTLALTALALVTLLAHGRRRRRA